MTMPAEQQVALQKALDAYRNEHRRKYGHHGRIVSEPLRAACEAYMKSLGDAESLIDERDTQ